ncbi:MAG: hypothetical protein M3N25_03120 [Actinomycetota bacterium]|nr:hypothetical protein [Actinomycetota bacterium]
MLRRMLTVGLKLGLLVGVVAVVVQALQRRDDARRRPPPPPWPPLDADGEPKGQPAPVPATHEFALTATEDEVREAMRGTEQEAAELQQRLATAPPEATVLVEAPAPAPSPVPAGPADASWVEPHDGACPPSHPVKAKLRSRVFHLPGMAHYDRTNADRCYHDAGAAEADGLRRAKR